MKYSIPENDGAILLMIIITMFTVSVYLFFNVFVLSIVQFFAINLLTNIQY